MISHTCEQVIWERTDIGGARPFIVWLQRGLDEDHNRFNSRIIVKELKLEILESHQKDPGQQSHLAPVLSIVAFGCVAGGYVSQVIGVAGMHYPAQIALFGTTIVMALAKMYLRRKPRPTDSLKTFSGHEVDWLALHQAFCHDSLENISISRPPEWAINAGQAWGQTIGHDVTGSPRTENLLKYRTRIDSICNWQGPATPMARAIVQSIRKVAKEFRIAGSEIGWHLPIDLGRGYSENLDVLAKIGAGDWARDEQRIRAVLSLWLFYAKQRESDSKWESHWTLHFLGPKKIHRKLETFWPRDMHAYFKRLRYVKASLKGAAEEAYPKEALAMDPVFREVKRDNIVGFQEQFAFPPPTYGNDSALGFVLLRHWLKSSGQEGQPHCLPANFIPAIYMRSDYLALFVRHMFSGFMWAFARSIKKDDIIGLEHPEDAVESNGIKAAQREHLIRIADSIAATGLAAQQTALLIMLAPLTARKLGCI